MPLDLPPCDSWACINSFSSWASVILTLVISGSSLVISIMAYRYARSKDIHSAQISLDTGFMMHPSLGSIEFLCVTVTNIGFRTLLLNGYAWEYKELLGKRTQLISSFTNTVQNQYSDKLPKELKEGQQAAFYVQRGIFVEDNDLLTSQNVLQAWCRIRSLKITAKFSTYRHTEHVPRQIKKMVWQQYRHARKTYNKSLKPRKKLRFLRGLARRYAV